MSRNDYSDKNEEYVLRKGELSNGSRYLKASNPSSALDERDYDRLQLKRDKLAGLAKKTIESSKAQK